jgi:hypothetical protein
MLSKVFEIGVLCNASSVCTGVRKGFTATSGHKQLLPGSEAAIFGLLMDFDVDQQLLGNDRENERRFSDLSVMYVWNMDVVQRSVIFHSYLKGHGYERIHTKLVATYGQNADTEDSVKNWVRE